MRIPLYRCLGFILSRLKTNPQDSGALKSNIGHLEGAAGIAGLIKAVLCLEKGVIPPNVDFRKVNPKIDPEHYCLSVSGISGKVFVPISLAYAISSLLTPFHGPRTVYEELLSIPLGLEDRIAT